jgi:hypothetical protein
MMSPKGYGVMRVLCSTGLWGILLIGLMIVLNGCGSSSETVALTPEQRFEQAKKLFDNGDYQEANSR